MVDSEEDAAVLVIYHSFLQQARGEIIWFVQEHLLATLLKDPLLFCCLQFPLSLRCTVYDFHVIIDHLI